ncbi:MAG: hypothetical protein ACFFBP_00405 [Promethearchaeota archaeon]
MDNICKECGMIRSKKDLVLMEDGSFLCFACWNKHVKKNNSKNN